jgi:hypothetical protein
MEESCQRASADSVFAFADIKAAVEDFDRGDANLSDALRRIRSALLLTSNVADPRRDAA